MACVKVCSWPALCASKDSSNLGLFFTFWVENGSFEFQLDVLHLGKGMYLL